jgi:flagellar motility protein MotE (MotC chaperone)
LSDLKLYVFLQSFELDIENKKILDTEQLNKVVSFYAKMEAAKAAESIAEMSPKIAMQILMKIKDKKASEILGNMQPNKAAQLIEGIAKK